MKPFKLRKYADFSKFSYQIPPLESMKKTEENSWGLPRVDVRGGDITGEDLSKYDLQDIVFDCQKPWPKDKKKCPKHFENITEVIELGKDPGLGIKELHKRGIDGHGMTMAIIDQLLGDHQEYHDNLVHYEEIGDFKPFWEASMHGSAVASLAVGKNVGVAPKAKLYFFARNSFINKNEQQYLSAKPTTEALKRILKINQTLSPKEKIQVVSLSWGGQCMPDVEDSKEWLETLEEAKKTGLFVLTVASDYEYPDFRYNGVTRPLLSDPNDPSVYYSSYDPPRKIHLARLKQHHMTEEDFLKNRKNTLRIPMEHRTIAAPTGYSDYTHDGRAGQSWTTPWLAGVYLLAKQVNPKITPEHFWEVALKTGYLNKKKGINVIQPVKLINTLEKELSKEKTTTLRTTLKRHCVRKTPCKRNGKESK